jgi:glycosyltransferase involved in cell wall biosynthesis
MAMPIRSFQGRDAMVLCHANRVGGRRSSGSGPLDPLLDYFRERGARYVVLVEQPHPHRDLPIECRMEVYREGRLVASHTYGGLRRLWDVPPERRRDRTFLRLKLRDVLAMRAFVRILGRDFPDLAVEWFFGVESLNVLIGAALRRRLRIGRLVYYVIDWAPRRYANAWLNRTFLWLDRQACRRADYTWNISPRIERARREVLRYDARTLGRQVTVPWTAEFRGDLIPPPERAARRDVLFSGGISEINGAHWLPAIARHVWQRRRDVRFHVTSAKGGDDLLARIKGELAADGVGNVEFLGFIEDAAALDRLACGCGMGLAPYPDLAVSAKPYGDVSKVRTYFAWGLPVVCSNVVGVADEIEAEGLGLVAKPEPAALAEAVLRLCEDDALFAAARRNVLEKGRRGGWRNVYDGAFAALSEPAGEGALRPARTSP